MKKCLYLITLFFTLNSFTLHASLTYRWLGITTIYLSDGKTNLLFDAAITHASLWDYLPFATFETNTSEVDYWLNRCQIKTLSALVVNHAHIDHASDVSYLAKKFSAEVYGSSSIKQIALGQGVSAQLIHTIHASEHFQVGDFHVEVFHTPHAAHFLDLIFMDGDIEKPLPLKTSVWDYKVGDTYSFLVKHPLGNILFQSIGRMEDTDPLKDVKVDWLFISIANRRSTEEIIEKRFIPSSAKKIIPLHYDNFFYPLQREGKPSELLGVNLEEFKSKTKAFNMIYSDYCQEIKL
jgi:L-ascorbate metabolism protein UlaG (beta-lactamase superfamily)